MMGNKLLERGTGPRWIGIVLPSQTCQERRELAAGPIASGVAVVRPDFGEDLLFEFQIGIQVNLGSLHRLMSHPQSNVEGVGCSSSMAAVRLSTCGVICFVFNDGHFFDAIIVYFFTRRCMASELRCPPLAFGNSAVALHLVGSLLQPLKIRAVRLQNGVTRCLRPFPVTSTCAPAVTVICSRVNPLISETRSPVA